MANVRTYNLETLDRKYDECKEVRIVDSLPEVAIKQDALYVWQQRLYRYDGENWITFGGSNAIETLINKTINAKDNKLALILYADTLEELTSPQPDGIYYIRNKGEYFTYNSSTNNWKQLTHYIFDGISEATLPDWALSAHQGYLLSDRIARMHDRVTKLEEDMGDIASILAQLTSGGGVTP